jgi:biopolymer transport protein ExbD
MIHMPHRSVTRFFVPLIDVLLLLFCIFLLMPFASEDELDKKTEEAEKSHEEMVAVTYELDRQNALQAATIQDVAAMKDHAKYKRDMEELEKLRKIVNKSVQQRYNCYVIDIERSNGKLSYMAARERRFINNAQDAKHLIAEKRKESMEKDKKDPYFFFLYPRPQGGYPTSKQTAEYQEWFKEADFSFLKD